MAPRSQTEKPARLKKTTSARLAGPALHGTLTESEEEKIQSTQLLHEAISRVLMVAIEPLSLENQLERILDILLSLPWLRLQSRGAIFLVEGGEPVLAMKAQRGLADDLLSACARVPFGHCLCGQAAAARGIVFADCVDNRHETKYRGMNNHGHYCVPIHSNGELVGLINLYVNEGHRREPEEELFLNSVATVIAGVIKHRQMEEALRESEERFELAIRGTDAGIWDWDIRTNTVYLSPRWKGILGYDADELPDALAEWQSRIHPDDHEKAVATIEAYLDGSVPDYELEHRLKHKDGSYRWILARGAALRDSEGKPYRMVGSLIDITSRKRLEEKLREKDAQLIAAAEIQAALLPKGPPAVPGFSIAGKCYPAAFAAGDHFDYLWLPDGTFLVVLGDVSGHGVGPAIVTAAFHSHFRAFAESMSDVTAIVTKVNASLCEETAGERFVTLIAGHIDPKSRTLDYVNAGHPPVFVLDLSGDVKARLNHKSMPLAIMPETEFVNGGAAPLADGDIVLFYTDGLIEAQPEGDAAFGIDRALEVVRKNRDRTASEMVEALYDAVRQHMGNEELDDDVTVVIVKVDSTSR